MIIHPVGSNLIICNLHKAFGKTEVLRGVNLEFGSGVTAILGPNGAGKTTLIRCAIGLEKLGSGTITMCGRNPTDAIAREALGVMLQDGDLPELLTPLELLTLFGSYYPAPMDMAEVLDLANIAGFANKRYGKLSGGQKRRVQFSLAIIGNPKVLFLDEPTTGLDLEARTALWQVVRKFADEGRTVILTTHYHEEAEQLADQIIRMKDGKIDDNIIEPPEINASKFLLIRCRSGASLEQLRQLPGAFLALRDDKFVQIRSHDAAATLRALFVIDEDLGELTVIPQDQNIAVQSEQEI